MAKTVNQNAVSVLPPTIGIKDPSTRSFLDALTNILDARSGYTDRDAPERFITAAEFQGLATRAISRAFSGAGALPGDPDGKIPSAIEVQESIENLAESIRKSLIYQILGEQFGLIDVEQIRQNITQLIGRADGLTERADDIISRVDEIVIDLEAGFTEEREARIDADEALTSSLDAAVSRIGASEAAIIEEQTTRASADSAMTSSLNAAVSRIGAAEAAIVAEQTTRANADSALTTSMNAAVSRIGAAESAIASEQTTRASADAALTTSLNSAVSRIGASESAIVAEQTTRASADAALTSTVNAVTARVGAAESAIASEQTTRSTKDMSLASAINTLWAEVGGAGSVIQDGSLASATPSSTQATKWRQVQSAVTDPNTGLVASAAMREDFTTYASNVDGRFNALYSVRAQLSTGGAVLSGLAKTGPTASLAGSTVLRLSANAPVDTVPGMYAYGTGLDGVTTVVGISGAEVTLSGPLGLDAAGAYTFTTNKMLVGGFGLAATGDSGSSQGGTIDFGVRADRFFIAATSETPDAATQIAQGSSIPFMVLTSPQAVNGVVYQPGVYLKKAVIGSATIGEAQIADLAVTNAKIGDAAITNAKIGDAQITTAKIVDLAVSTLKIQGEAVTVPRGASASNRVDLEGWIPTDVLSTAPINPEGGSVYVSFSARGEVALNFVGEGEVPIYGGVTISILRNGAQIWSGSGFQSGMLIDYPGAGSYIYTLRAAGWDGNSGPNNTYIAERTMVVIGCKR